MKLKVLKILGFSWVLAFQAFEPALATPLGLKDIMRTEVETDSSIPSPSEFIGVDLGSKHLLHSRNRSVFRRALCCFPQD